MLSSLTAVSDESRAIIDLIERHEKIRAVGLNSDDPDEIRAFERRERMSSTEKFLAFMTLQRLL